MGQEVLAKDREIVAILAHAGIKPKAISDITMHVEPGPYGALVNSDLDADRIDYLLRTSQHTGLPYGSVDLTYLARQIGVKADRVSLKPNAVKSVDHFLLARYFDHSQIAFHKTVAGFEFVLRDVLSELLNRGNLDCKPKTLTAKIESGEWRTFDDNWMLERIRDLQKEAETGSVCETKTSALLERRPPKLLGHIEYIHPRNKTESNLFELYQRDLKKRLPEWAASFDMDPGLWHVWAIARPLTSIGSNVPVSLILDPLKTDKEALEKSVWILNADGSEQTVITEIPYSLMNLLGGYALYGLRVYALVPDGYKFSTQEMSKKIAADEPYMEWKR